MSDATTTAPAVPAAKRSLSRYVQIGVGGLLLLVFGVITLARLATWGDLPGCDSKRARDTLSNVFRQNNLKPTRYDEVKTLSSTKDEIACTAILPAEGGGRIEVDYRFFKQDLEERYQVTRLDRKP